MMLFVHYISVSDTMSVVTKCTCIFLSMQRSEFAQSWPFLPQAQPPQPTIEPEKECLGIWLIYLGRERGFRIVDLPSWNV